jgi:hypothetical protein
MDGPPEIGLSLLEGMDEELLAKLYGAGIRTRDELGTRITTAYARDRLARELGIPSRQLRILQYLNFLLPEERAQRALEMERRLESHIESARRERRRLRWMIWGLAGATLILLAALVLVPAPYLGRPSVGSAAADTQELAALREIVEALRPLGTEHAEANVLRGVSTLGPAPGWGGPLSWNGAEANKAAVLLGEEESSLPPRVLSLLLAQLTEIENASVESLSPLDRARTAAQVAKDVPPPDPVETVWDAAAILLRERLRSRALGLASTDGSSPNLVGALPWEWTAPGFLTAEELLTRVEALPVAESSIELWAETLMQVRAAADEGRDALSDRPEAFARDYWIRRGELELAVVAALLGRDDLFPYNERDPRGFLLQRQVYLVSALEQAPAPARRGLLWLGVAYAEALDLLRWLEKNPGWRKDRKLGNLVETLDVVETIRAEDLKTVTPAVAAQVGAALGVAPGPELWVQPRVRWEAGLDPLLMGTRAAVRRAPAGSASG